MSKQEYRRVLEILCDEKISNAEKRRSFNTILPLLKDDLMVEMIKHLNIQFSISPDMIEPSSDIRELFHYEHLMKAQSDLEEYVLERIQERGEKKDIPSNIADEAFYRFVEPVDELSLMKAEVEYLRMLLLESEKIRKEYQKGKYQLYMMGGTIQQAAMKCLPKEKEVHKELSNYTVEG
jgi:hypothetical protein